MIKIAFTEHIPPYDPAAGGIASYIHHRACVLGKLGFEIWWFNSHRLARWKADEMEWGDRREFAVGKFRRRLFGRWPALQPTWQYLVNEVRVDIIELMAGANSWLPFGTAIPRTVLNCHTSTSTRAFLNGDLEVERHTNRFRPWAKRNLSKAHGILAPSNEIAMLEAGYFHLHPDRITVLPYVFSRQAESGLAKQTRQPAGQSEFLVVGNVEYFKGLDLVLNGFANYCRAGRQGRLLIAGCDGAHEIFRRKTVTAIQPALAEVIKEHGENSVSFLGKQTKEQLAALRQRVAAVICGSRFESWSMVAGESFLSGCPLILSNRTGFSSHAQSYQAARLVSPYDAEDMAKAMTEMENPDAQARYIRGGDALADYLTSDELAETTAAFYRRVLGRENGRQS